MKSSKFQLSLASTAVLLTLAACGGGGGDTTAPVVNAPVTTPVGPTAPVVVTPTTPTVVVSAYTLDNLPPNTYAAADTAAMFDSLNKIRIGGGFGALEQSTLIDQAAKAHADYVGMNYFANGVIVNSVYDILPDGWLRGHAETTGVTGFTGSRPIDRIAKAGYAAVASSEVIAYAVGVTPGAEPDRKKCLSDLVNSVFHRAALLDTTQLNVGFGISGVVNPNGYKTAICVLNFGSKVAAPKLPANWTGVYPFNGQLATPLTMGLEAPDPVVSSPIKGGPVSFQALFPIPLTVTGFVMRDANAQVVNSTLLTRTQSPYLRPNEAYLVPGGLLKPNATYFVSFTGSSNGVPLFKDWSFTTAAN